jgi:TRAP-type C4-dicarboxylate transport system permease small subunit
MSKFLRGVDGLAKAMMVLAASCAFAIAFAILVDVLARNSSIKVYGVPEYIRNSLIVIIFLQLPFAVRIRSMLCVDMIVHLLPAPTRTPIAVFGSVLGALFFGAVAFGALGPAIDAWVTNEDAGQSVVFVAAWPARFSIVFGCALAAFYYLVRIYDVWRGHEIPDVASEIPRPIEHI